MFNLWNVLDDVMRADPWFRPFLMGPESENASSSPLVDIAEADAAYLITAELPGVRLEDVKLEIQNDVLTLSAQKQPESAREQEQYHRVERSYGTYTRSFALPKGVQSDDVQATMKDGVLTIRLPKTEQARARHIPINVPIHVPESRGPAPAQITAEASQSNSPRALS